MGKCNPSLSGTGVWHVDDRGPETISLDITNAQRLIPKGRVYQRRGWRSQIPASARGLSEKTMPPVPSKVRWVKSLD